MTSFTFHPVHKLTDGCLEINRSINTMGQSDEFQLSTLIARYFQRVAWQHSQRAVIIIKSVFERPSLFSSVLRRCVYVCTSVFEGLKYYVTGRSCSLFLSLLGKLFIIQDDSVLPASGKGGGIITWLKSLTRFFHVDVKTCAQVAGRWEFPFVSTKTLQFLGSALPVPVGNFFEPWRRMGKKEETERKLEEDARG